MVIAPHLVHLAADRAGRRRAFRIAAAKREVGLVQLAQPIAAEPEVPPTPLHVLLRLLHLAVGEKLLDGLARLAHLPGEHRVSLLRGQVPARVLAKIAAHAGEGGVAQLAAGHVRDRLVEREHLLRGVDVTAQRPKQEVGVEPLVGCDSQQVAQRVQVGDEQRVRGEPREIVDERRDAVPIEQPLLQLVAD